VKFGATRVGFDELLAESDFVSINCTLTDETRYLFGPTTSAWPRWRRLDYGHSGDGGHGQSGVGGHHGIPSTAGHLPPVCISRCDELLGTRPGLYTLGALDRVESLRERDEVCLHLLQPGDLGIDLRRSPPQKVLCVTARTQTAIADVQELLDLLQTQSDALGALDELESFDGIVLEGAVPGCGAIRRGKESRALVVADRVGRQANPVGELRDGQCHSVRVNLGVDSNVNPIAPWAARLGLRGLIGLGSPPAPRPPPGTTANRLLLLPVPLGLLVQVIVIAAEDHLACQSAGELGRTPFLHDGYVLLGRRYHRLPGQAFDADPGHAT
jgi:hypothetical protein